MLPFFIMPGQDLRRGESGPLGRVKGKGEFINNSRAGNKDVEILLDACFLAFPLFPGFSVLYLCFQVFYILKGCEKFNHGTDWRQCDF